MTAVAAVGSGSLGIIVCSATGSAGTTRVVVVIVRWKEAVAIGGGGSGYWLDGEGSGQM